MDFKEYSAVERETPELAEFRKEVRAFLDKEVTDELRRENESYFYIPPGTIDLQRKLGAKGWLMPELPKEYGGAGLSVTEAYIIAEEIAASGIRVTGVNSRITGPIIMQYGTEEQKKEWLPRIATAEMRFSLGYTEPNAGTDLAALETTALPDGDDYIVNGQKLFSTGAHLSTHQLVAVKTNLNVPKHKGISLLVVDLKTPGVTVNPLQTIADERSSEIFYDNVRVPRKNRLGEENAGWSILKNSLAIEREVVSNDFVDVDAFVKKLIQYTKETEIDGRLLSKNPLVRQSMAQLTIDVNLLRLFTHRANWLVRKAILSDSAAAMVKVWSSEAVQRASNIGTQIMGLYGQLEPGSKGAPFEGFIELVYRFSVAMTYGGGSNELMRCLMATQGMGLPR